jgi:hypothetical protein
MKKKQLPSKREIIPTSPESAPKLRATFTDEFKRDAVARLRAGNQSATRGRGHVRHSYTISALAVSICSKVRLIKCRYGSADCLARDVKSGGDVGHAKSGRQISACHCLVSVAIADLILRE